MSTKEKTLSKQIEVKSKNKDKALTTQKSYKGISTANPDNTSFTLHNIALIKQDIINHFHISQGEKLENPEQMIDFQTEYTKELHGLSDYPKIDFELIRKNIKEWEHHKVEDIMTYRNKSFSSPVTGSVAPIHHTPWASAMDDSSKAFLDR